MAGIEIKSFDSPNETRPFEGKGRVEIITLRGREIGKGIFEPGWRWSENVKPIAQTGSCEFDHLGYMLSGRMRVTMATAASPRSAPATSLLFRQARRRGDRRRAMRLNRHRRGGRRLREARPGGMMVEFKLTDSSSSSAEAVIAAARDFSRRRIEIWPNVSARSYQVHANGETFAEVTEAALQGFVWERSRYEWTTPGAVRQTVVDSNALAPGCTWEITATSNGDGCEVECVFRREFKHTPKGLFAWVVNRFGARLYGWDLRRALGAIESQ